MTSFLILRIVKSDSLIATFSLFSSLEKIFFVIIINKGARERTPRYFS